MTLKHCKGDNQAGKISLKLSSHFSAHITTIPVQRGRTLDEIFLLTCKLQFMRNENVEVKLLLSTVLLNSNWRRGEAASRDFVISTGQTMPSRKLQGRPQISRLPREMQPQEMQPQEIASYKAQRASAILLNLRRNSHSPPFSP